MVWNVLKRMGHVEHVTKEPSTKSARVCWRVGGIDRRCTNRLGKVKKACNARTLELRDAKENCFVSQQWRNFVNGIKDRKKVLCMAEYNFDELQ